MKHWMDIVNVEQRLWLYEQTEKFEVLSVTVHGSHLYGLAREGSDVDIKVVYQPSFNDLIMGDATKTYNEKNDDLNIEVEIKSLTSFMKSAKKCDTNCMDILHTPRNLQIKTTPVWDKIKSLRSCLYAKDMRGLVGYIKTHTSKYSNKTDRLNEMKELLSMVNYLPSDYHTIEQVCSYMERESITFKYIKPVSVKSDHEQDFLEVCGKKYTQTWNVSLLQDALKASINSYGKSSNDGVKKGMDTKSLSHALRVLSEVKQIASEGTLTFPLKDSEFILSVKTGEVDDIEEVYAKIHQEYEECMELLEKSNLPEKVDITLMLDVMRTFMVNSLQ